MKDVKKTKIALITSTGGHLFQMYRLKPWWSKQERFWVTFDKEDSRSILATEKKYFAFYPESRHILNAIKNLYLAWFILKKERPDILISCGAGIAPPFFYIGKILGMKLIFIEPYDFIFFPSLASRLVNNIVDVYLVQHKNQLSFFKNARYVGSLL